MTKEKIPSVLSFEKKLVPSDGYFYGAKWNEINFDNLQEIKKHVDLYFIEIVCETEIHSNRFFTEKTLKN